MAMTEEEYTELLHSERRRFAWMMERYGGHTPAEAEYAALAQYPYEHARAEYRWLVFHRDAWSWAMRKIHSPTFWHDHPDLASPSEEYRALP